MAHLFNSVQKNPSTLSIPQLLDSSEESRVEVSQTNYRSPDSSGNILTVEPQPMSGSESLTQSQPLFSQLSESLTGRHDRVLPANSHSSISSNNNSSVGGFVAPTDPNLLLQYNAIMSRPGPRSLKRRRVDEFVNNNNLGGVDILLTSKLLGRIGEKLAKRKSPNNSSSSLSSSNPSLPKNQAPVPVPIHLSPYSSQFSRQSPSVEPFVPARERRQPSSSLSSEEERIPESQFGRPRGTISGGYLPPSPDHSPPLPAAVQRISPPLPVTARRRINDGNAHSNAGAPRRVVVPSLLTPGSGDSGRDPRSKNTKTISGG